MKRKIALLAVIMLSLQIVMGAFMPVAAEEEVKPLVKAEVPSIVHEEVEGNLIKLGHLDNKDEAKARFATSPDKPSHTWVEDENGGYIEGGKFPNEYTGFKITVGNEVPAGTYKLTFYARTLYEGHKTKIAVMVYGKDGLTAEHKDGQIANWFHVGLDNGWTKVEYYFTLKSELNYIVIRPTPSWIRAITPVCLDEFSLVPTKRVPGDMSYNQGINVTAKDADAAYEHINSYNEFTKFPKTDIEKEKSYEVEGIMLNFDNTAHGLSTSTTRDSIVTWINQFDGTHVTDMVWNIAESKTVYPTDVFFGWYGDGQTTKDENGVVSTAPSNQEGAYSKQFITNKFDYIKVLSEELPKAGINFWMSIRMNDAHDRTAKESGLFTEYFFNHPEYRRTQYPTKVNTYFANIWDYSYPEIRNIYLALLNESLDRYDAYGYQLEWQREMWLFHHGGEYAGLEIMNQFMRDADAIVSVYEEKYGHPIKLSVNCAPDLQTNYDFGLDIMTWVSEGILDMIVPMGRHGTSCNETPVALWNTLVEPYGVELVPCIEHAMVTSPMKKSHDSPDIEHYAGTSALFLSQGADQIQIHNILIPLYHVFKDKDKVDAYDPSFEIIEFPESSTKTEPMWWVLLITCGSYEKLMTLNRKVIPTYNDVAQSWKAASNTAQLPITCRVGASAAIRIGMGDVPEGAKVTVRLAPTSQASADNAPTVYVNSELCTFVGIVESYDPDRTEYDMWEFEIPAAVHDDMFATVEIIATKRPGCSVEHAEIYIAPAK